MKSTDAETVAQELVKIFARSGIPDELLADQGSNFVSELLNQLSSLLRTGIRRIKTSPYHPQTDGLVERFNGTLKRMLRRFVQEAPGAWDELLPYLLFSYREVPQASTGFSSFELLFGRHVRGPLDVLREAWTEEDCGSEDDKNVLSYSAFRQKFPKLWTSVAHSFLQQIAQNKTELIRKLLPYPNS